MNRQHVSTQVPPAHFHIDHPLTLQGALEHKQKLLVVGVVTTALAPRAPEWSSEVIGRTAFTDEYAALVTAKEVAFLVLMPL